MTTEGQKGSSQQKHETATDQPDGGRGPLRHVLVCLDSSAYAEEALPFAALIGRKFKSHLELAHVLEASGDGPAPHSHDALDWQIARVEAEDYLAGVAGRMDAAPGLVTSTVLQGRAADQIIARAKRDAVDLIILASHGESGPSRWPLGSTAEKIVARPPSSILVVPVAGTGTRPRLPSEIKRVLVLLDGSPRAESVLPLLEWLVQETELHLVLLHVTRSLDVFDQEGGDTEGTEKLKEVEQWNLRRAKRYIAKLQGRLSREGCHAEAIVEQGDPRQVIPAVAERERIDLIAITSHGCTGDNSRPCGDTAAHLVRNATLPILMVQSQPHRMSKYAQAVLPESQGTPARGAGTHLQS